MFGLLALWAIMALSFPLAKMALVYADAPLQLIGLRMTLAGCIILVFLLVRQFYQKGSFFFTSPSAYDLIIFLKVAIFHVYLAFVPEFWALQFLDSLKANLLFSLTPFVSALLSFALLAKRLQKMQFFSLLLGSVGMLLIMLTQNLAEANLKALLFFSMPELALMLGVVSACYAWFEIRKLMLQGYDLLLINGIAFLLGGLFCLAQHSFFGGSAARLLPATAAPELLLWICGLILCSNILGYHLYGKLLHRYSSTFLSFTGFLCPIFGAVYAKFFAQIFPQQFCAEPISGFYVAGFLIILLALGIFYAQEIKEQSSAFF